MITDKKIGVIIGGISSEREVSLKSGEAVFNALKSLGYNAVKMDVKADVCEAVKKEKIDLAFLVLHGGWGEDGGIQGLFEVMGIPYTGSDLLSSALAMNKEASKKMFFYHEIPTPKFFVLDKDNYKSQIAYINFEFPWVAKPACEGSSVGVSIIKDKTKLKSAFDAGFLHGDKLLIEEYIDGKEIHIGILNNSALGGVEVRPSLEFYSYEAKYTAGLTEYILPPEVDEKIYKKAADAALAAHKALGCRGATRVDTRIDKAGNPYVLEVNTLPGMTETSLLPKIAKHAGLDFSALIEEILKETLQRGENAGS
ncbi:MAG: D-alanine--D-alanine ligase [Nitrospiraceae bacterium]|nr:D-alanine--D-alanine ligase [Nitrospiraceae bacterium]